LPGKPLVDIHGKPMIYWVAKRVAASHIDKYCVATDDQRILDVCERYSIPCVMTSERCVNGTERVAEVAINSDADYFVNIQGDEPCINVEAINNIIASVEDLHEPKFIQAVTKIFFLPGTPSSINFHHFSRYIV